MFFRLLFFSITALTALLVPGLSNHCLAGDGVATILIDPSTPAITGLKFDPSPLEISPTGHAIVVGQFKSDSTLILGTTIIQLDASGRFRLEIKLAGPSTPLILTSVDPSGQLKYQRIQINFPEWTQWKIDTALKDAADIQPKYTRIAPALGVSNISYDDSRTAGFQQLALTGKLAINHAFKQTAWDIGVNAYYTLASLGIASGASARYFGSNARLGYTFRKPESAWSLTIAGGFYYTTSFITAPVNGRLRELGFSGMAGPQLFPVLRRSFSGGSSVMAYIKYSPVTSGFSVLSLDNRELAIGGGYIIPLKSGNSISITLDSASLDLVLEDVTISSRSVTLGFGYSFGF
jgi:hypothetical protein